MAVYVTPYLYTDEGIKGIKSAAEIAEGWQAEAKARHDRPGPLLAPRAV